MADGAFPDGLDQDNVEKGHGWRGRANPFSLILLAALLGIALTGILGGRPSPVLRADTPAATLTVKSPATLRNGMFFETVIVATPKQAAKQLTIAVEPALWRDFTVNTMIPQASDETFEDGKFRFGYGPVEAGKALTMKVDSQINPSEFGPTHGTVGVYDGDRLLAELAVTIKVRP